MFLPFIFFIFHLCKFFNFFSNIFVYICIKLLFFCLIFSATWREHLLLYFFIITSALWPLCLLLFLSYQCIKFRWLSAVGGWRVAAVGCLLLPRGLINNTRKAWHLHISAPTDCLTPLYVKHQFCICCDLHSNSHTRPQTYNWQQYNGTAVNEMISAKK